MILDNIRRRILDTGTQEKKPSMPARKMKFTHVLPSGSVEYPPAVVPPLLGSLVLGPPVTVRVPTAAPPAPPDPAAAPGTPAAAADIEEDQNVHPPVAQAASDNPSSSSASSSSSSSEPSTPKNGNGKQQEEQPAQASLRDDALCTMFQGRLMTRVNLREHGPQGSAQEEPPTLAGDGLENPKARGKPRDFAKHIFQQTGGLPALMATLPAGRAGFGSVHGPSLTAEDSILPEYGMMGLDGLGTSVIRYQTPMTAVQILSRGMLSIIDKMPRISPRRQRSYKCLCRWIITMTPVIPSRDQQAISGEGGEDNVVDVVIEHEQLQTVIHRFRARVLPERRGPCKSTEMYELTDGLHEATGEEAVFWSSPSNGQGPCNGLQAPLAPTTRDIMMLIKAHFRTPTTGVRLNRGKHSFDGEDYEENKENKHKKKDSNDNEAETPTVSYPPMEGSWGTQEEVMNSLQELNRADFSYLDDGPPAEIKNENGVIDKQTVEEQLRKAERKRVEAEKQAAQMKKDKERFQDAVHFLLGDEKTETIPGNLNNLLTRSMAIGALDHLPPAKISLLDGLFQAASASAAAAAKAASGSNTDDMRRALDAASIQLDESFNAVGRRDIAFLEKWSVRHKLSGSSAPLAPSAPSEPSTPSDSSTTSTPSTPIESSDSSTPSDSSTTSSPSVPPTPSESLTTSAPSTPLESSQSPTPPTPPASSTPAPKSAPPLPLDPGPYAGWRYQDYDAAYPRYETHMLASGLRLTNLLTNPKHFLARYNEERTYHWGNVETAGDEPHLPQFKPEAEAGFEPGKGPGSSVEDDTWRWDGHYDIVSTAIRRDMMHSMIALDLLQLVHAGREVRSTWKAWASHCMSLRLWKWKQGALIGTVAKGSILYLIRDLVRRKTFLCGPGVRDHYVRTSRNADVCREDGSLARSIPELSELEIVKMTEEHRRDKPELQEVWEDRTEVGKMIEIHRILEKIDKNGELLDPHGLVRALVKYSREEETSRLMSPFLLRTIELIRFAAALIDARNVFISECTEGAVIALRSLVGEVPCLHALHQLHEFPLEDWASVYKYNCHRLYTYLDSHIHQLAGPECPSFCVSCSKSISNSSSSSSSSSKKSTPFTDEDVAQELYSLGKGVIGHFHHDARISLPLLDIDRVHGRRPDISERISVALVRPDLTGTLRSLLESRKPIEPIASMGFGEQSPKRQPWSGVRVPPTPRALMEKRVAEEKRQEKTRKNEQAKKQQQQASRQRRQEEEQKRAKVRAAMAAACRERYEAKMKLHREAEAEAEAEVAVDAKQSQEKISRLKLAVLVPERKTSLVSGNKIDQKPRVDDAADDPKDKADMSPQCKRTRGMSNTTDPLLEVEGNDSDTQSSVWDDHKSDRGAESSGSEPPSPQRGCVKSIPDKGPPQSSSAEPVQTKGRIQHKHWDKIQTLFGRQQGSLSWPDLGCALRHLGYAQLPGGGGGSAVRFIWTEACLWPLSEKDSRDGLGALNFHRIHHNKDIDLGQLGTLRGKFRRNGISIDLIEQYYEVR